MLARIALIHSAPHHVSTPSFSVLCGALHNTYNASNFQITRTFQSPSNSCVTLRKSHHGAGQGRLWEPLVNSSGEEATPKSHLTSTSRVPSSSEYDNSHALPSLKTLLPPTPSSHHNLSTFLDYARRQSLDPSTKTYIGTRYEYHAATSLRRLGLEVVRIGKTGDKGVDLVGYWHLPASSSRHGFAFNTESASDEANNTSARDRKLKVVLQCKRLTKKIQPSVVREMEGAFRGAPVQWRGPDVLGIVISTKEASRGVIDALKFSSRPIVWICLDEKQHDGDDTILDGENDDDGYKQVDGKIGQIIWNRLAGDLGLVDFDVVKQMSSSRVEGAKQEDTVVMMKDGKVVEPWSTAEQNPYI